MCKRFIGEHACEGARGDNWDRLQEPSDHNIGLTSVKEAKERKIEQNKPQTISQFGKSHSRLMKSH